ncbi:hypothetical protein [Rhodococcus sp. NPDC004095]
MSSTLTVLWDRLKKHWQRFAIGIAAVVVVVFLATYFSGVIWFPRYTADQWAAAGGWAGGIGAVAAVTVALWQASQAKARAEADAVENKKIQGDLQKRHDDEIKDANKRLSDELAAAEERHQSQLKKSDELLTQELDEQRRMRQVDALGVIWNAIAAIEVPANNMTVQLTRVANAQLRYLGADPGTPAYADIEEKVRRAGRDFEDTIQQFAPTMMAAEISFTTAMMVVNEPNTLEALEKTYQAFVDFRKIINASVQDSLGERIPADVVAINAAKSKLNKMRDPMIKTVREHLTRSRPLRKFDTEAI